MSNSGFLVNGSDLTADWPDLEYVMDRYSELVSTYKSPELWTWGRNNVGQLGNSTLSDSSVPVQLYYSIGVFNTDFTATNSVQQWQQLSVGGTGNSTAVIKSDNRLWLWGDNSGGILGNNNRTTQSSPVQTISSGSTWMSVSSSLSHTAGIKNDGSLWLWGTANYGHLGNNAVTARSSPVQTISGGTSWKQVCAGNYLSAAIKTDGSLWMWGIGTSGEMGNNAITSRSSPVQTISGGKNWSQVSCNDFTAAIKTDGTLWLWGANGQGQLGDNTSTNRSSPVQTVAQGTNWKYVSAGVNFTAAIKTDGTLWTWGLNLAGQLGINNTSYRSSPVQTISGGTNWKYVSCGSNIVAAIKTDGTLWTWGANDYGQLGDGTIVTKSSPVQTVAQGTNWKQISCKYYHMTAIKESDENIATLLYTPGLT